MKVKNIHFVPIVPGQPIYEMANGEIRLPFPDGSIRGLAWLTEKEMRLFIVDKSEESLKQLSFRFEEAKKAIDKEFLMKIAN